jgi:hypothetical protein
MDALNRAGTSTKLIGINEDIEDTDMDKIHAFQFYGAYPFSVGRVLKYLKEKGKKIVYDCDDALNLVDPTNPWYYDVMKDLGSVREILSYADEITVSTPQMGEYIKTQSDVKVTILPNYYSQREWTFPRPNRKGLRIGYSGSASHVSDLIPILPVIKKLQDKYNFTFILFGFGNEGLQKDYKNWYMDYRYVSSPEGQKELEIFDKLLSEIRFEWVPYVDFEKYPSTLTNIALDIGLCPLKDTPFNRCRSACKAMEYTLSGALALASDIEPYRTEPTSVLVTDWESTLEYYITHLEECKATKEKHLEWLRQNRNIDDKIELLKEIYNEKL